MAALAITAAGIIASVGMLGGSAAGAEKSAPSQAAAMTPGAGTATTLTATGTTAATSCSSDPKQNGKEVLHVSARRSAQSFFESTIELWYSPTCRTVWAIEANGLNGDNLWVYNQNTGAISRAIFPTNETGAINDAGTVSHACMQNNASTFPPRMVKACTGWF
jgi:hypothetical protein